jgi:hypothetical protein
MARQVLPNAPVPACHSAIHAVPMEDQGERQPAPSGGHTLFDARNPRARLRQGGTQHGDGPRQKSRPSLRGTLREIRTKTYEGGIQYFADEITKRQRPYHVAWVGDRLTITPPPRPGPVALNRWDFGSEMSWSFSPGSAERTMSWGSKGPNVIRYVVDSVEIAHDTWTSGHGVTDRLNIRGPEYSSTTVVALEHHRQLFNYQVPPGRTPTGACRRRWWALLPSMACPQGLAKHMTPTRSRRWRRRSSR